MSIYVGTGRINYPAMRGPCPYGYHVGTSTEWTNIKSAGTTLGAWTASGGTNFSTYLKMPLSGYRDALNSNVTGQGTEGRYRCCSNYNTQYASYATYFNSSSLSVGGFGSCYGFNVRPIKDDPVVPTSSWTTIYQGTGSAGIFWNSSSGLISISKDGTTWYTIADKNLGASTVYNSGDTLSEANCGKYFQHGNDYPFPYTGTVTKSSTKVSTTGYGPGNRYYSSTFIYNTGNTWSSTPDGNLRGGVVGAVKADVKDICVGAGVDDYSAMQGPCPAGFHVPTGTEWIRVVNAGVTLGARQSGSSGLDNFISKLHIPKAGQIWENTGNYTSGYGYYRGCNASWLNSRIYISFFQVSNLGITSGVCNRCQSIRAFKDVPVVPDSTWTTIHAGSGGAGIFWSKGLGLISISSDGTTRYTIQDKNLGANVVYNSGDTLNADNCGGFFQGGNNYMFPWGVNISTKSGTQVDPVGFGPGNYYSSSTFITASSWISTNSRDIRGGLTGAQKKGNVKHVYVGTTPARPTYNPGIYWNKAKGLISISSDGKNWITMADKNLGAKVVYNDGDTLSQDNCGCFYQRGNNYGFPRTGSITTSSTRVSTSTYSYTNPYYSKTFITYSSGDWSSNQNDNLWGNTADTLVDRQGPCPTDRHVGTKTEWTNLLSAMTTLGAGTTGNNFKTYVKMPIAGYRARSSGSLTSSGTYGRQWTSTCSGTLAGYYYIESTRVIYDTQQRSEGFSIRPFKNEPVVPDNSRAVLYQPS